MNAVESILENWHLTGTSTHAIVLGLLLGISIAYSIYLSKESIKSIKHTFDKKIFTYYSKKAGR
jgi:hypothetical protein